MTLREVFTGASIPAGASIKGWSTVAAPGGTELRYPTPSRELALGLADALTAAKEGLRSRSVREIVEVVGRAAARLLDPADELRERAELAMPGVSGLSDRMCKIVIAGMARDWTGPRLSALIDQEFGGPGPLDRFIEGRDGARVRAESGSLALHLSAGNVPGVGATSLIRSLLVKSPVLLKPGLGDVVLPVLLREAIEDIDPQIAAAICVVYWPGGSEVIEEALLEVAAPVVVYGSLATVGALRARVPARTAMIEYPHRVGVGILGRDAVASVEMADRTAQAVAAAVAAFDQRGCVSPHLIYLETGGAVGPEGWVEHLAEAMSAVDATLPPGGVDPATASAVQQLRGSAEIRSASGERVLVRTGGEGLGWTVLLDPRAGPASLCGARTVSVVPVDDAAVVPSLLAPYGPVLQTVAMAGVGDRAEQLAEELGRVGAVRVVPFEEAPWPPAWWRHDGGDPLRALVRWVEWMPEAV